MQRLFSSLQCYPPQLGQGDMRAHWLSWSPAGSATDWVRSVSASSRDDSISNRNGMRARARDNLRISRVRIRRLSQEEYLKRIWAALLIVGMLSLSVDLWRDGIILVKGVPLLTTLGATVFAVTLSSMLSWQVQVARHERADANIPRTQSHADMNMVIGHISPARGRSSSG